MAATFTALGIDLAWAANKNMFSMFNTSASLVTKIYRIWMVNSGTATVSGGIGLSQMGFITSAIAGAPTAITPVPHDPAKTTLTGLTVNTAGTVATLSSVMRTILKANDELAAAAATYDEFSNIIPLNLIWDCGYGDLHTQPITLRQNQGFCIRTTTAGTGLGGTYVGTCDIWAEFTHE